MPGAGDPDAWAAPGAEAAGAATVDATGPAQPATAATTRHRLAVHLATTGGLRPSIDRWYAGLRPSRQPRVGPTGSIGVGSESVKSAARARPSAAVAIRSRPRRLATKHARSAASRISARVAPSSG